MSQIEKYAKHVSLYAVSSIAGKAVGFLMLPIYTRYLTPADYGIIALIMVALGVLEGTLGVRLVQAVAKFYYESDEPEYRNSVVSTATLISLFAGAFATFLVVALRGDVSNLLFSNDSYGLVVALFSFTLITQGMEAYGLLFIRLNQLPVLYLKVNLVKLAIQLSLNVWFIVILEMGLLGVALANFISFTIVGLFFAIYVFSRTGIKLSTGFAVKLIRFEWPLWLSGLIALYVSSADKYFVRYFDSIESVGLLGLAQQLAVIVTVLIWTPFFQFWGPERFQLYNRGTDHERYRIVFVVISAAMILAAAGLSILSPIIIKLMAAEPFHPAYLAVPLLCVGEIFGFATMYSNLGIMVKSKTVWIARISVVSAILTTALLILLVPRFGFVGAAAAYAMTMMVRFLIIYFVARRLFDMKLQVGRFIGLIVCVVIIVWSTFPTNESALSIGALLLTLPTMLACCIAASVYLMATPEIKAMVGAWWIQWRQRRSGL